MRAPQGRTERSEAATAFRLPERHERGVPVKRTRERFECDGCGRRYPLEYMVRCSYEPLLHSMPFFDYGVQCFKCANLLVPKLATEPEDFYLICRAP